MGKVESHNQSGGMTAHEVNVNSVRATADDRQASSPKRLLRWILPLLGAAASLIAILTWFGIGP